jgi:hypothetical protein
MTAKADVLNNMVGLGEEFLAKENFASRQILFACEKLLHAGAIPDPVNSLERFDHSWIHRAEIAQNPTFASILRGLFRKFRIKQR